MLGTDFVERNKHGGVDRARDVEKGAGDALYARDAAFLKFRCSRGVGRLLHLGTIRRCETFVGRMLRARGHGVLEELQVFADRVEHGYVNVIARVVQFDIKFGVLASRGVDGDGLTCPERVKEVGDVVGGKELDSEVIYSKGEGGRQGYVGPKTSVWDTVA